MKLKSNSLHFEIMPGSSKPSGYIRNSYREDGKIKHQTVSRINGLSLEQLKMMKAAFEGDVIDKRDIVLTGGREYGAGALLFDLAKKIGLDKIIYSRNEAWVKDAMAMIIGRIVYQGSKLSLSKAPEISCLWEICGVKDSVIDADKRCYESMDQLTARQSSIQKKLAAKHLADGAVILYDMTSSYFEGDYEGSEIVTYGYSRDKKRGKKQITVALICTKEGCPVSVEVFSGNTTDCTTVKSKLAEIKDKYAISKFVFVGDRGMWTQKNLTDFEDIDSITALTHDAMKKLCEDDNVQLSLFDEESDVEVVLPEKPSVRYVLRKNPVRGEKERNSRMAIIEKTEEALRKIAIPKKKTDDKTLAVRAAKIFLKYKSEKYFSWSIVDTTIIFCRKTDIIAHEEKYDGLYVIRTNVEPEFMNISQVVDAYKSLINAETAFRNIKTVHLEMRPIYHKTDERIKAHVFLCMLSYYLLWHMNTALKTFYDENPSYTHMLVIEVMKVLQKVKLSIADIPCYSVAEPTPIQQKIQNAVLGSC